MPQKCKAVVIDDVALCRDFLAEVLDDRGYEVTSYASAEDFVHCSCPGDRCQAEQPCVELLLTDNHMPHLTGLELIEKQLAMGCKLAAGRRGVVSGYWKKSDLNKAEQLGCQVFEKPYNLKKLNDWFSACEERVVG